MAPWSSIWNDGDATIQLACWCAPTHGDFTGCQLGWCPTSIAFSWRVHNWNKSMVYGSMNPVQGSGSKPCTPNKNVQNNGDLWMFKILLSFYVYIYIEYIYILNIYIYIYIILYIIYTLCIDMYCSIAIYRRYNGGIYSCIPLTPYLTKL